MDQDFKVDGFILVARECTEPEVLTHPNLLEAYDIFLEDDDCRLGVVMHTSDGYRVFSDEVTSTYSRMQGAVRRVWELSNADEINADGDDWASINSQLGELGINLDF